MHGRHGGLNTEGTETPGGRTETTEGVNTEGTESLGHASMAQTARQAHTETTERQVHAPHEPIGLLLSKRHNLENLPESVKLIHGKFNEMT